MFIYPWVSVFFFVLTVFVSLCTMVMGLTPDELFNFLSEGSVGALGKFVLANFFYILGGFVGAWFSGFVLKKISIVKMEGQDVSVSDSILWAIVFLNLILVVILFVIGGLDLFYRNYYQDDNQDADFLGLLLTSAEQLVALLPMVVRYFSGARPVLKKANRYAFVFSVIYLYCVGTKFVAVAAMLYLIAGDFKYPRGMIKRWYLYLCCGFLFFLVLLQRSVDDYGLFSVFAAFGEMVDHSFDNLVFVMQVIVSPVYIFGETVVLHSRDFKVLGVELSPLLGEAAGWYDIADSQRVNYAIPFSALGVLFAFGPAFVFFMSFVTSFVFAIFSSVFSRWFGVGALIFVVMISFMHVGLVYQYNLRSAMRWDYYLLFASSIGLLVKILWSKTKSV